jgi:hypothetical protein
MGWKIIHTAPDDGKTIDLWHPRIGRITDCWWEKKNRRWFHMDPETGASIAVMNDLYVTHWMDIPKAPKGFENRT